MTSRPQLIVLLTAWLVAAGVPWDAIQLVAWGRMFAENARAMPVLAAARQTFDPQAMCGVCCAVQKAKREQRDPALAGMSADKAPIVLPTAMRVNVAAPGGTAGATELTSALRSRRDPPPLPPPRDMLVAPGLA